MKKTIILFISFLLLLCAGCEKPARAQRIGRMGVLIVDPSGDEQFVQSIDFQNTSINVGDSADVTIDLSVSGGWTQDTTNKYTYFTDGNYHLGLNDSTPDGTLGIVIDHTSDIGIDINACASQGVNIVDIDDSAGSALFTIDSAGRVGIGINVPTAFLHINGSGTQQEIIRSTDGSAQLLVDGFTDSTSRVVFSENTDSRWQMGNIGTVDRFGIVYGTLGTTGDNFTIDSSGLVGINDVTPDGQLDITNGNAARIALDIDAAASQSANIIDVDDSSGNEMFTVSSNGNVTINEDSVTTYTNQGLTLVNDTSGDGVTAQWSPSINLRAEGWSGSATQQCDWHITGVGNINGNPTFSVYVTEEGGGTATILSIDSFGQWETEGKWAAYDARETYINLITLSNSAEAAAGYDQFSPTIRFKSLGWDTTELGNDYISWGIVATPEAGDPVNGALVFRSGHDTQIPDTEIVRMEWDGVNKRVGIGTANPNCALQVDGKIRSVDSEWYSCRYLSAISLSPGGSGATLTVPSANSLGGYNLDADNEYLYMNFHVCDDWDETSDIEVFVKFETDQSADAGDAVVFDGLVYFKGEDESANKVQYPTISEDVSGDVRYTHEFAILLIDYDDATQDVDIGDTFGFRLNFNATDSGITDVIVNQITIRYKSKQVGLEIP